MFFMHTNEMVLHRLHKISKRGNKQPKVLTLGKVSPIVKYRPWDLPTFDAGEKWWDFLGSRTVACIYADKYSQFHQHNVSG